MAVILAFLLNVSVVIFAVSSTLSVGLGYSVEQIVSPLRNTGAVIRALVANFVLVPLLTIVVILSLPMDPSLEIGLMLIATAAGSPFSITLTRAAGGAVDLAATLLVVLIPATIVYMPIVVPLLEPEALVNPVAIARPLVLTMLLPLAAGLFVRARAPEPAEELQPLLGRVATISLVVLIVSTFLANLGGILGIFGIGPIVATFIVIVGAFVIGYLLVSPNPATKTVLGLGTGQRNIAAATIVATQAIGDPNTIAMVVFASLVGLAVLFPIAGALRRVGRHEPTA